MLILRITILNKKFKKGNIMENHNSTPDNPVFTLPPHKFEHVLTTLSQKQGWQITQNNLPETWFVTKGENKTAMVIDTGHPEHIDLGKNSIKGKNFTNSSTLDDRQGHQTHVTGIICAKDNEIGMVGVAPQSKCISVKALGDNGNGSFKWIENALEYAIEKKPNVVSMSLGSTHTTPKIHKLLKELYKMNIPVVCAAGNSGNRGVDYPASYPETIAVAAYDKHGKIARFSAVGEQVDWAAPGYDIYSTYLNNSYAEMSGTSMACPFITGIILLLLSKHEKQEKETGKNDCKTVEEIRQHLLKYTIGRGFVGRDKRFGYGIIDVKTMLLAKNPEGLNLPLWQDPNMPCYKKFWNKFKKLFKN